MDNKQTAAVKRYVKSMPTLERQQGALESLTSLYRDVAIGVPGIDHKARTDIVCDVLFFIEEMQAALADNDEQPVQKEQAEPRKTIFRTNVDVSEAKKILQSKQ